MYLKDPKRILQNKRFWRAPELHFCVHRDKEFWLKFGKAILTKYKLRDQNNNFFYFKRLSCESTNPEEHFSYIKHVYISSRKNFKAF